MKRTLILVLLLAAALPLAAQRTKPQAQTPAPLEKDDLVWASLKMMAKGYPDDRIVLRWSVDNTAAWPLLQHVGVWIDYVVLDENNRYMAGTWTRLNTEPVKPWPAERLKAMLTPDSDESLLMAAQALYGSVDPQPIQTSTRKPKKNTEENLNQTVDLSMGYENMVALGMLAADRLPQAAEVMGLRYEHKIPINTWYKYGYRLYPAGSHPLFRIDTAFFLYPGRLKDQVHAPSLVQARGKDGVIEVFWPRNATNNYYTFFNIERSEDGKTFSRLNEKPLPFNRQAGTDYAYADSVENYKRWYYRVNGVDAFGDESYWSGTVSAMGRNLTPPSAVFLSGTVDKVGKTVRLSWDAPPETDLKGFLIRRGEDMHLLDEAVTEKMLPVTTTHYVDKPRDLVKGVYYQVIAVDTASNYSMSNIPFFFEHDTIPPLPPTGIRGIVDTAGIARLTWNRDYGDNVYAWRVFVSNNPKSDFSPASGALVLDTVFVDTLSRTLTNREIYYRVVALDGYNNHSEMSEIVKLQRPKIAPSPVPVIGLCTVRDREVSFEISVYPDPENRLLYIFRRELGEEKWTALDSIPSTRKGYSDKKVVPGKTYQYMVRTKDIFNMFSRESFPLQSYVYHPSKAAPDPGLTASVKDGTVVLRWKKPRLPVERYILYRDTGEGMLAIQSLDKEDVSFSEEFSGRIRYGLEAVYEDKGVEKKIFEGGWVETAP